MSAPTWTEIAMLAWMVGMLVMSWIDAARIRQWRERYVTEMELRSKMDDLIYQRLGTLKLEVSLLRPDRERAVRLDWWESLRPETRAEVKAAIDAAFQREIARADRGQETERLGES